MQIYLVVQTGADTVALSHLLVTRVFGRMGEEIAFYVSKVLVFTAII